MPLAADPRAQSWPDLPLAAWSDTYATLHMWTQIVGKIRLAQSAWLNHSWHVTLYVTARGLTTSPVPYGRFWRVLLQSDRVFKQFRARYRHSLECSTTPETS